MHRRDPGTSQRDAAAALPAAPAARSREWRRPGRAPWLNTLALITRRVTAAQSIEEAAREMVELLARAFDLECVAYFEIEPVSGTLRRVHGAGNHNEAKGGDEVRWPVGEGLVGQALTQRRTIVANDAEGHPAYNPFFRDTRAELCVPVLDGDRAVGVLDIQARRRNYFSPDGVEVVEAIAAQFLVARRAVEMRGSQERRIREQEVVNRVTLEILAMRPWEETLRYVTRQVRRLCNADSAGLYLMEPDGRHLRCAISDHVNPDVSGALLLVGEGLAGRVAASGESMAVRDYAAWEGRSPQYEGCAWHSIAAVPLRHGDRVIGVIDAISEDPRHAFGPDELRILELLAAPSALAISNARQVDEHAGDLAFMGEVARELSGASDTDAVRRTVCRAARRLAGAQIAVLLASDGRDGLVSVAVDGLAEGRVVRVPASEPFAASLRALRSGEAVMDLDIGAGGVPVPGVARATGTRAVLAQPVVREGRAVGVLTVGWAEPRPPVPDRMATLMTVLAGDAAVALERAELVARLDEMARSDALTGAANRRSWEDELPRYLARARRDGEPFTIAMLDIDHFKAFNDVQGHQRGDLLLRQVVESWRRELREVDLLARYGGEEFAVALPGCPLEAALTIVERLRAATPGGQTCSAGVACWDGDEGADALVARADAALYQAKVTGRNRSIAAVPEAGTDDDAPGISSSLASWTRWIGMVPRLLAERCVSSVYQPVIDLRDGSVRGYEALARPAGGSVLTSVDGLFAAAQYRGLTRDLDWICRRAAVEGARDRVPHGTPLFVNVSVSAMLDPLHDVDQMLLLLEYARRSPHDVVLEITEREAVADVRRFAEVLAVHRAEGFRFAIDDVGEGHSTLEVLAAASPEYIKVARGLMVAAHGAGARSAIRALVAFARSSGAAVIAEGIESEAERTLMLDLGVQLGQGFALAEPQALLADDDVPELRRVAS